jgi:hypothetical protein
MPYRYTFAVTYQLDLLGEFKIAEGEAFGVGYVLGLLLGVYVRLLAGRALEEGGRLAIIGGVGVHFELN